MLCRPSGHERKLTKLKSSSFSRYDKEYKTSESERYHPSRHTGCTISVQLIAKEVTPSRLACYASLVLSTSSSYIIVVQLASRLLNYLRYSPSPSETSSNKHFMQTRTSSGKLDHPDEALYRRLGPQTYSSVETWIPANDHVKLSIQAFSSTSFEHYFDGSLR